MTRTHFDQQLENIQEEMLSLALQVEVAMERSVDALSEGDEALAKQVIEDDVQINEKRYEIEETCLELIATQQPLAGDLRTIASVLHIVVDLERMGDHAEGIARVALMMPDEPPIMSYADIRRMAEITKGMMLASLEAFKDRDTKRAREISDEDDRVDDLYDKVLSELLALMTEDKSKIERATHLTWVAHNLERIADRVTNICERIVYLVDGTIGEMNVSKY
ncbi:MAG: phosphate signaling complex protein PhoU [Chloroflexi bacterium]|nr:phosphate signaling complex protein PhoU [Chloroflexota bacterium]MCH8160968.1 phosphate signaling complex protein PhoU [Chloroflexota bacterium]